MGNDGKSIVFQLVNIWELAIVVKLLKNSVFMKFKI